MAELVSWRKSSYSGSNSNCVEVAFGETVAVRDTKARRDGALALTPGAWSVFLAVLAASQAQSQ
ncbi:protein of unknown function [Amycolatopsis marina]|uniref:DUF397 domain-containing protein n=1 Tax=Amycolatopsis marina TaxID=490629 RepID=A0A1I0V8T7_9PSEU|nr:DUF397 domain-containing protein [Amycolatopsis marina]SFA72789.1 protein of unknown function [Amycolatopsis marina]